MAASGCVGLGSGGSGAGSGSAWNRGPSSPPAAWTAVRKSPNTIFQYVWDQMLKERRHEQLSPSTSLFAKDLHVQTVSDWTSHQFAAVQSAQSSLRTRSSHGCLSGECLRLLGHSGLK